MLEYVNVDCSCRHAKKTFNGCHTSASIKSLDHNSVELLLQSEITDTVVPHKLIHVKMIDFGIMENLYFKDYVM